MSNTTRRANGSRSLPGMILIAALAWSACIACNSRAEPPTRVPTANESDGIWISSQELGALPMEGPAWEALVKEARLPVTRPNLSDQDDPSNVRVLAKALYFARTGEASFAEEVTRACQQIRGTERHANALAISRELMSYVIAADLVGLAPAERREFETWLRGMQARYFLGRSIRTTHENRPNNWGTHAGATRLAVAAYLGDTKEIERAAYIFRGWTGDAKGWKGFEFGDAAWQSDSSAPVAINPVGAVHQGHSIDGVLPDDQRRGGRFRWPPPQENYVYEALQGAVAQANLLDRLGYDAWSWGDRALLRAFKWLHAEADFPATGDDTWLPHIINKVYAEDFPAPMPSLPGKGMGFTDWTHTKH